MEGYGCECRVPLLAVVEVVQVVKLTEAEVVKATVAEVVDISNVLGRLNPKASHQLHVHPLPAVVQVVKVKTTAAELVDIAYVATVHRDFRLLGRLAVVELNLVGNISNVAIVHGHCRLLGQMNRVASHRLHFGPLPAVVQVVEVKTIVAIVGDLEYVAIVQRDSRLFGHLHPLPAVVQVVKVKTIVTEVVDIEYVAIVYRDFRLLD